MSRKPAGESPDRRTRPLPWCCRCVTARLQVLLWQRAREPYRGAWALPGGLLEPGETLEESIRRHLATKVDVREVSHIEQLATYSGRSRDPSAWELATAYLGLVELRLDPDVPGDTRWHPVDELPRDCVRPRRDRPRGARAATRQALVLERGFRARTPHVHARRAARGLRRRARSRGLGNEPSPGARAPGGDRADRASGGPSGRAGGRPAEVFRFRDRQLEITDPFAALRPRP